MINRIEPPKYRIGRYVLNEYELRYLMTAVAKKLKPHGIVVKDINGVKATIQKNGTLSNSLYGLDINSSFTLELIKINRDSEPSES